MDKKTIFATMYLKDGVAVNGKNDLTPSKYDALSAVRLFNDSGIDKLLLMDISEDFEGHQKTIKTIKEINRVLEMPAYAYGWIETIRDVRDYSFAGCEKIIINSSNPNLNDLINESEKRYGKEKLSLCIDSVDVLFKQKTTIEENFDELVIFKDDILEAVTNMIECPFYAFFPECDDLNHYIEILKNQQCLGVGGMITDDLETDIARLKNQFRSSGISVFIYEPSLNWSEFQLDNDGLIAVVTQDYATNEVLNYGYMNEQAFYETITSGKMTYYNKTTGLVTMHGSEAGNYQYIKSLSVDCHKQALLAKISQIGSACHTGNNSCFFTEVLKKDYIEKNIFKLLENKYTNISARKKEPKDGSYTTYLYEKGINEILRKLQHITTDMTLCSKDEDIDSLPIQIADLLYITMVLMCEYDIRWDDITREMGER